MSYGPRQTNVFPPGSNTTLGGLHGPNTSLLRQSNQTQSALQTRINAKRAELENLRQLRDLSGNLAEQLSALEGKLSTLKDGAQSVALVLANWENVLRAINMAAMKVPVPKDDNDTEEKDVDENDDSQTKKEAAQKLPVPLVRIPVQQKETKETGG